MVDVYVDNTNGKLSKIKTMEQLTRYVKSSSVLSLIQDSEPTVNLLRYVMDNGDVVEITTDGHTAILNGNLLSSEEKQALFNAIKSGEIKVARKADMSAPVPVFPDEKRPEVQAIKPTVSQDMLDAVDKFQSKITRLRNLSTKSYDHEIESGDYSGAEDPAYVKRMLYLMRYGE